MYLSKSVIRALSLGSALIALLAAAACGNGGTITVHTTGNYSDATLNGTYVYEVHGDSQVGVYREIGAFTADGNGNITAGSDDSNLAGNISFTGTYQVFGDGTGSITFNNSPFGGSNFAITVVSSSKVKLMEGDSFADGGGTAELQSSASASATPNGTFVFRLHEFANSGAPTKSASEVGAITISAGSVTGDRLDQNLGGTSSQFTLSGGTFSAPSGMGRGTATITGSSSFSKNLTYYIVNSGRLILLVTDPNGIGSGEAESQSGAVANGLAGNYAFGSRGDDPTPNGITSLSATVGNLSASGGAVTSYNFDAMQDGSYFNGSDLGTYTTAGDGRTSVILNSESPEVFWMVNPGRAFFLINSAGDVEDGTADLQTVNSFVASTMNGQYAMIMDGVDLNVGQDLARVGAMVFDGAGKLSLSELVNGSSTASGAQPPQGGGLKGNYQIDSTGRITASVSNSSNPALDIVMYAISGSDAYALQVDSGTVTSGTVSLQH